MNEDNIKEKIVSAFNVRLGPLIDDTVKIVMAEVQQQMRQLQMEKHHLQGQIQQLQPLQAQNQQLQAEMQQLQNTIRQLQFEKQQLQGQMQRLMKEYEMLNGKIVAQKKENYDYLEKIKELERKIDELKRQNIGIRQPVASPSPKETVVPQKEAAISLKTTESPTRQTIYTNNILEKFNNWASNPSSELPREFSYLEGEIKMRTAQYPRETSAKTQWICNKSGEKKYLFPNPNFFDQMTDISDLYLMDVNRLREKGRNKIKVTIPCEMMDSGYINFQGRLELLQ